MDKTPVFQKCETGSWSISTKKTPMYSHEDIEQLATTLGCQLLPEMVFHNELVMKHKGGFVLQLNAKDALAGALSVKLAENKHIGQVRVSYIEWEKK